MCLACDNLCCISAASSGCGCNDCPEDACHVHDGDEPKEGDSRTDEGPSPLQVAFDLAAELGGEVIAPNASTATIVTVWRRSGGDFRPSTWASPKRIGAT
jgi:hypothetical protein